MTKVYLAGPFFCVVKLERSLKLKKQLADRDFDLVLPQDNFLSIDTDRIGDRDFATEISAEIFVDDLTLLDSCDTFYSNSTAAYPTGAHTWNSAAPMSAGKSASA